MVQAEVNSWAPLAKMWVCNTSEHNKYTFTKR